MGKAPVSIRNGWPLLLALLLAVRLLAPAGFMPSFAEGVTIVACPDEAAAMPMPQHKRHSGKVHQLCPYAAASTHAVFPSVTGLLIGGMFFFSAAMVWRPFILAAPIRAREPPRPRGPPILD